MGKYKLLGKTIEYTDAEERAFDYQYLLWREIARAKEDFSAWYSNCGDIKTVLTNYVKKSLELIERHANNPLYNELSRIGIYDATKDRFVEECSSADGFADAFDEVRECYNGIIDQLEAEIEYREERKENRGRVVGGGFGFSGAVKGMATAGAMNALSGAGHSIVNAIGNAGSEMEANAAKRRLYENKQTLAILRDGIITDIVATFNEFTEFVNERKDNYISYVFFSDKADALFENAKKLPENRVELLREAFEKCPWDLDVLSYIFKNYRDERKNVWNAAQRFHVNVKPLVENTLESDYDTVDHNDEKAILKAKTNLLNDMAFYGFKSSPTLSRLNRDYLLVIYRNRYAKVAPGKREDALRIFREYDMSTTEKVAFFKEFKVWELKQAFMLSFNMQDQVAILTDTYKMLNSVRAEEDTINQFIDSLLQVFEYEKGSVPVAMFEELCGINEVWNQRRQKMLRKKMDMLESVFQYLHESYSIQPFAKPGCIAYQNDTAASRAKLWEKFKPLSGEVPVLAGNYFVLTDRRIVFVDTSKTKETPILYMSDISVKKEFLGASMRFMSMRATEFHIVSVDGVYPDLFEPVINETVEKLKAILEEVEGRSESAREELDILKADAVRKHQAEVALLGMEETAAKLIAAGEAAKQKCADRKIREGVDVIFAGCDQTSASVAVVWKQLLSSTYPPQSYAEKLDALFDILCENVRKAKAVPKLHEAERARAEILAMDAQPRLIDLEQEIANRIIALDVLGRTYRGIVFDSEEEILLAREEERNLDVIMRMVAQDDIESIDNAILQISESPSLIKMVYLDMLNNYKATLSEQQRTYRGVVYDTVEQAEHAKNVYVAVRSLMNQVDVDCEQSVVSAYEQIVAMNHPLTEEALGVLKESMDKIDIRKRTVDGIVLETLQEAELARDELTRIQIQMSKMNENDEEVMLAIQEAIVSCTTVVKEKYLETLRSKLAEYDIRVRTFHGVVYDTRELAAKHREEAVTVSQIMQTVGADDEPSLLAALQSLEKLTTDEKNIPIATLTTMLKEYDIRVRTVAGVLYDTREEAQLIATEIQMAESIMQNVSADDEQSILNAQREILKLTTFVKDSKYDILNQMWHAYDVKVRTYLGIVFATRKQAQTAQDVYTDFLRQFNTLDLSQRSSVTMLTNYVEDCIPPELTQRAMEIINDVRKVLDVVDYIVQKDASIDMTSQKKESAELHKQIEAVLPCMARYRMNTDYMQQLKDKHFASLNVSKKLFSFIKSKL